MELILCNAEQYAPTLQKDDVMPTLGDNIQPKEATYSQPAAATASSSKTISSDQPTERGQPVQPARTDSRQGHLLMSVMNPLTSDSSPMIGNSPNS
eukprot:2156641-Amphidinium_carterae.3